MNHHQVVMATQENFERRSYETVNNGKFNFIAWSLWYDSNNTRKGSLQKTEIVIAMIETSTAIGAGSENAILKVAVAMIRYLKIKMNTV